MIPWWQRKSCAVANGSAGVRSAPIRPTTTSWFRPIRLLLAIDCCYQKQKKSGGTTRTEATNVTVYIFCESVYFMWTNRPSVHPSVGRLVGPSVAVDKGPHLPALSDFSSFFILFLSTLFFVFASHGSNFRMVHAATWTAIIKATSLMGAEGTALYLYSHLLVFLFRFFF